MANSWEHRMLYLPLRLLQPGTAARLRPTAALQELSASIRQVGVLQPLTVRKNGGQYVVVSGNRRLTAARMAGLTEVPCILMDPDRQDPALIALTENLQREDLHYLDEAELLRAYLDRGHLSQAQAARRLGRSQSAIANKLRLLRHGPRMRQLLREQGLTERHARALLRVEDQEKCLLCAAEIAKNRLSVAQAERYIDIFLQNGKGSGENRLRRRDTRLFLERVSRDTAELRRNGVAAELDRQEDKGEIVLTVRIQKE